MTWRDILRDVRLLTWVFSQIFFNVMWKYYGQQSFPLTEQEYLEHLQV